MISENTCQEIIDNVYVCFQDRAKSTDINDIL